MIWWCTSKRQSFCELAPPVALAYPLASHTHC
jgi:hypothetical protein